jgi:hypothetical protein
MKKGASSALFSAVPFVALALGSLSLGVPSHVLRKRSTDVVNLVEPTFSVSADISLIPPCINQFSLLSFTFGCLSSHLKIPLI